MRSLLTWFNARRRLVALALLGLIAVIVVSAGRTPENDEWFRVPDLSGLLAIGLGLAALVGLVLIRFGRPTSATRKPSEMRSLRAVVVFTILVVVAIQLFGPDEPALEPIVEEVEQPIFEDVVGEEADPVPESNATDTAALALILVIVVAVVVRTWRSSKTEAPDPEPAVPFDLGEELAPAVEEAHGHLADEADPRTAVLLAYASLEDALADLDLERHPTETPSEYISRVLADLPDLATPAIRLGKLYEVARFSKAEITEDQRGSATEALDRARIFMPVVRTEEP